MTVRAVRVGRTWDAAVAVDSGLPYAVRGAIDAAHLARATVLHLAEDRLLVAQARAAAPDPLAVPAVEELGFHLDSDEARQAVPYAREVRRALAVEGVQVVGAVSWGLADPYVLRISGMVALGEIHAGFCAAVGSPHGEGWHAALALPEGRLALAGEQARLPVQARFVTDALRHGQDDGGQPALSLDAASPARRLRDALGWIGVPGHLCDQGEARADGGLAFHDGPAQEVFGSHRAHLVRAVPHPVGGARIVGDVAEPSDGFLYPFRLDCERGKGGRWSYAALSVADPLDGDGRAAAAGATPAEALGAAARHLHELGQGGSPCRNLLGTSAGAWLGMPAAA